VSRVEEVDLSEVVREAATDHGVLDRQLFVTAPPHAIVVCDRQYVRRIIDNLVDNAFKYGQPPVRVEVEIEPRSVSLAVLDAGRGVAEADRERVFDRFQRLDTMSGQGLGLGLSVVQGLVEAMGGDIRVEEAPGGGAAFRIRFPRPVPLEPSGAFRTAVPGPVVAPRSVS
jgi:signal transduction histidine kinase